MTNTPDYLNPYEQAAQTHGPAFEATLWMSKPKQLGRFEVFVQEIDLAGRSIIDAGAGLADLAQYLLDNDIQYERYIALEGVKAMADQAAARNLPRTRVHNIDFASDEHVFQNTAQDSGGNGGSGGISEGEGVEVILFSGSLNTFQQDHALAQVDRAWQVASHAVAFNFLSDRHHKRNPVDPFPAVRFNPVEVLDFALARTPAALIRQDYYEGHDCTCIMWKPGEVPQQRWVPASS